jgi:acyl-CoA synthetase (AMP-forming)/AMP-acid ligase II
VGAGDWPTEPELHAFCRDHLVAYKTPVTWMFVDAFLPIASGKVRKNVLHERRPAECLHRPSGDLVGL